MFAGAETDPAECERNRSSAREVRYLKADKDYHSPASN